MPFFADIAATLSGLKHYAFGKGILTLGVLAATGIASWAGIGILLPALAVTVGGLAFTVINRLGDQRRYEDRMVELYRDDIATHRGIAPNEVTRADLAMAAQENEVIHQALKRQRRKTIISIATATLSAAVTFGLVDFFSAGTELRTFASAGLDKLGLGNFFAPLVNLIGIGTVSALTGLVFHTGLQEAIGQGSGVRQASAHDLIMAMDHAVARGRTMTPEQVYQVLVVENPPLGHTITAQFGKSYGHMTAREQRQVLNRIGVLDDMHAVANAISNGSMSAGHLAYMIGDSTAQIRREAPPMEAPTPVKANFVERLGLAPRVTMGHAERVADARAMVAERVV